MLLFNCIPSIGKGNLKDGELYFMKFSNTEVTDAYTS